MRDLNTYSAVLGVFIVGVTVEGTNMTGAAFPGSMVIVGHYRDKI